MPLSSLSKVLRLSTESLDEVVDAVCRILSIGGVVALPTDTLYGLTTTLEHSDKLYQLKHRSCSKPLGLFVASADDVGKVADSSTVAPSLLRSLLPGPVTLLFERLPSLPVNFNFGVAVVGVRVPECPLVQAVTKRLGVPLAQTSANFSGGRSPVCIADFEHLVPLVDLVVDGGMIGVGNTREGSTVIDLSAPGRFRIVRPGCALPASLEMLVKAGLNPVDDENNEETASVNS